MAIVEKVGVYRKWLEPVPEKNGNPIPKSEWPKKRRHCWIVRWCGTDRKKYGKLFKTRKEAEKYALDLQKQVNLGRADKPEKITLQEFRLEHEQVMKGQRADATLDDQNRALRFFENFIGGSLLLSKIKPRHAEAFIAHRLSTVPSVSTVNKDIRTLRRIFNLAIEPRGYLAEGQNPFTKIKKRKITERPIRYVNLQEYGALMDAATKLWWKAFLSVAYGSGLRRNEILHLTWADVDLEQHRIKVQAKRATAEILAWEPKNRKNRVVPMSDETARLLVDMQVDGPELHPYVFVSPERLDRIKKRRKIGKWHARSEVVNNLRERFNTIRRHANVAECTMHDLRRSAITNWARQLPIQVVQTLAGHTDIKTTRKYYLAVRPEDFDSASEVLNLVLSKTQSD
ncbi:MAG: site-specific integrase [Deltaproteobacteria bacterium]|nr:site-specific integrase [Deltaproteobacteria bacterium]